MITDRFFQKHDQRHMEVLEQVAQILNSAHPGVQLKRKYGIPMFVLKKNIAYLDIQKDTPIMGVVYGIHLEAIHHLLDFTGRKQIGHFQLTDLDEDKIEKLHTVIFTAVDFDLSRK